ncbi:MAG: hypothetical protein VX835_01200 [Pseudomonadota bacterium]|nr:hypothetical protein [Pseudomonadota bacterium]
MRLHTNSPLTLKGISMFNVIQLSLGSTLNRHYLDIMEVNDITNDVIESFQSMADKLLIINPTLELIIFLDLIKEEMVQKYENIHVLNILDNTIDIASNIASYVEIYENIGLNDFADITKGIFEKNLKSLTVNQKITQYEKNENIVIKYCENNLDYLAQQLDQLFNINQLRNDPKKNKKLLAMLYQSYVVNSSLYKNAYIEIDGKKINLDFKHIEELKFVKELKKLSLAKYSHQKTLAHLPPLEDIDLCANHAIKWMPDMVKFLQKNPKENLEDIKTQLTEIDELCKDYANQLMTWMILAINDSIEDEYTYEKLSSMPFEVSFFGVEEVSDVRPSTPVKEIIKLLEDNSPFEPITLIA